LDLQSRASSVAKESLGDVVCQEAGELIQAVLNPFSILGLHILGRPMLAVAKYLTALKSIPSNCVQMYSPPAVKTSDLKMSNNSTAAVEKLSARKRV